MLFRSQQGKGGGESDVVKGDHTIIITEEHSPLFQKTVSLSLPDRGSHGEPAGFLLFRITYLFTLFLFVLVLFSLCGMTNHQYLFPQFICRTGHQPAARLFLIIPARFFDALLKMLNRKFRMKIVPGEAFFNKTALP